MFGEMDIFNRIDGCTTYTVILPSKSERYVCHNQIQLCPGILEVRLNITFESIRSLYCDI